MLTSRTPSRIAARAQHAKRMLEDWVYAQNIRDRKRRHSTEASFRERARADQRRWKAAHPDAPLDQYLRHTYGISLVEYRALHEAQGGLCAICGCAESKLDPSGQPQRLSVDHDHSTEDIRELICDRCNTVLGRVADDPELLLQMANYLIRHAQRVA